MGTRCVVPVRVTVAGTPDPQQLEALTERVAARVGAQLDRAAHALRSAGVPGASRPAVTTAPADVRERWDAGREGAAGYATPAYDGAGRPVQVPLAVRRRWIVLRALDFRATVADFLAAVAHQREEGLPEAMLYAGLAAQERWVEVWWVRTNVTIGLGDLEYELVTRAGELAHRHPDQILANLISPFTAAWEDLSVIDGSGAMDRLPRPGPHNAHRVEGGGRDATILHGGWAIFAFMVLPAVTVEDNLTIGPAERVAAGPAEVTPLVDEADFLRRFGVEWPGYAAELGAERIEVRVLPLRVRRRVLGITAWYLASLAAADVFGPGAPDGTFGVQDLFLLTDAELAQLPPALTAGPRAWAGAAAPATAAAAPDLPLEAGWPLVHLSAAIPVDDELIGRVRHGSAARVLAARIRAALAGDTGAREWPTRMLLLLRDALGTAPGRRPPGGTLFEHTLRDLEGTHDLVRLFDTADDAGRWPLRLLLYQHAAATTYAAHPRVAALGAALSARREATRNNLYQAGGAGAGWVDLDRDPAQRVRAGDIFGEVDGTFIKTRTEKQLRPEKAEALARALLDQRHALTAAVGSGLDATGYSEEAFAREVLARAVRAAGISNDDFTSIDIERSLRLAEVVATTEDGLPSFDVRFRFVERVAGGQWQPAGREVTDAAGKFEARLVYLALGRAGEVYEALGIGIAIVGGIAVAFEAGLVAALVDLAGGATAVAVSITISEVIYIIRVVLKKDELSVRGGGDLLFSTVEGRVKHRNMLRDPRVSVSVIDSADPENYVELRGRVSMTPDAGRRVDTGLSWKYDGKDPGEDRPGAVRVVVRMVVEKTTGYAA